jgi:hypothetical protein
MPRLFFMHWYMIIMIKGGIYKEVIESIYGAGLPAQLFYRYYRIKKALRLIIYMEVRNVETNFAKNCEVESTRSIFISYLIGKRLNKNVTF